MSTEEPPTDAPRVLGGRYEIHRRLARGGMAEVYLARDRALDRPVAVKILFSEFATDPAFVERFRREAQAAANLTHPNIVAVYDWGTEDGTYFIVMEMVDGQSLAEVMRSAGPLHPRRAAEIAFEVAGALGFAHANGVVHRDVKPGNVLIAGNGVAKVTDFGIARAMSSATGDNLTQAGSVMGTATYFSPEQAQGFAVDARSDLYSLGVVLFEMVAGRPPFTGESPVAIAYKHVQETPPRPSQFVSQIPVGLEAIIGRLLAKNPDHRYLSADDLRVDLRRWLDGEIPVALEALQRSPATVATAAVAGAATGAAAGALTGDATRVAVPAVDVPSTPPSDDGFDEEETPNRTGLFIGLLAVLLAAVAGLVFWLVRSLNDEGTVATATVPDVVTKLRADAERIIRDAGLVPVVEEEANDNAPEGTVFAQDPEAGTELEEGSRVTLKVSTGAATGTIPAGLLGRPQAEVVRALNDAGFTKVTPVQVERADVAEGLVVAIEPAPGSTVPLSTEVKVQVSKGLPGIPIPDVKGKTVDQARRDLTAAGFIVGETINQPSADVEKGRVAGTDPTGSAPKSTVVNLIVSTGPQQVKVPAVRGQSEADATAAIRAAGLGVEIEPRALPPGDPNIGRVVAVSPAAGTLVDPGSTVTITVGVAGATTTSPPTTAATTTTSSP
jgi:serine/threonine-protein kinase